MRFEISTVVAFATILSYTTGAALPAAPFVDHGVQQIEARALDDPAALSELRGLISDARNAPRIEHKIVEDRTKPAKGKHRGLLGALAGLVVGGGAVELFHHGSSAEASPVAPTPAGATPGFATPMATPAAVAAPVAGGQAAGAALPAPT